MQTLSTPPRRARGSCKGASATPIYRDLRERPGKQLPIEKVVGLLEALIFGESNGYCRHRNCIVPNNEEYYNWT
jgi:hypothetical protein